MPIWLRPFTGLLRMKLSLFRFAQVTSFVLLLCRLSLKIFYEDLGTIPFGIVVCTTFKPNFVLVVLVHLFPFKGDNVKIQEGLRDFGVIKEVKFQTWTNVPGLYTGTRNVRMMRKSDIPRNIKIDGLPCKIWCKDQPMECDICRDRHKAASCSLKGKCRQCRGGGHFARDCSSNPWATPAQALSMFLMILILLLLSLLLWLVILSRWQRLLVVVGRLFSLLMLLWTNPKLNITSSVDSNVDEASQSILAGAYVPAVQPSSVGKSAYCEASSIAQGLHARLLP